MTSLISRFNKENKSARGRLSADSQLYLTLHGKIEAALVGKGPSVLISHGSAGGYDMGIWLARLLGGQFKYIAPSRFGYLRSPVPSDSTPEAQADLYAALLDELNISSVVILALSAGGPSALQFALRHQGRCRGLIMLSAISRPIPPLPRLMQVIYPLMLKSDLMPWLVYNLAPQLVFHGNGIRGDLLERIKRDPEKRRLLDALYQTSFPSSLRREGMLNDVQHLTTFPVYPIEEISVPTLVIHAVDDPIVPFCLGEYSAQTIPHSQFVRLDGGGHFSTVTHKEKIVPEIRQFLDSIRNQ